MKYSEDAKSFFLNEENKKKKKEIEDKYEAKFYQVEDSKLTPEFENVFLNNIMKFEEEWENAKEVEMYEYLDKPKIKNLKEIKEAELPTEIDKILELYEQKNINIDVIEEDDLSDEDLYKFLSEELMQYRFYPMPLSGMQTNFIYEEFHPSKKLDSKDAIDFVLYQAINNSDDIESYITCEKTLRISGVKVSKENFIKSLFKLFEDVEEEIDREIKFKKFEFSDINKVEADLYLIYKQKESAVKIEKIINFSFELIVSEYGGMEIIDYACDQIKIA